MKKDQEEDPRIFSEPELRRLNLICDPLNPRDVMIFLYQQILEAELWGDPFTKGGKNAQRGIYRRRKEFPEGSPRLSYDIIDALIKKMIESEWIAIERYKFLVVLTDWEWMSRFPEDG